MYVLNVLVVISGVLVGMVCDGVICCEVMGLNVEFVIGLCVV